VTPPRCCQWAELHTIFAFGFQHVQLQRQSSVPTLADGISFLCLSLLQGRDTQRVYRLYDFRKTPRTQPDVAYCLASRVTSADKFHPVIESLSAII
jgi:hypothetical protein